MTQTALSRDAMLAGLQDIRLPADAPGGLLAELLAGAGLGALAALLILLALRLVTARPQHHAPPGLADDIAAARALPDDARRVALLAILKARAPDVHAGFRDRLYGRDAPETAALEAEVARLA